MTGPPTRSAAICRLSPLGPLSCIMLSQQALIALSARDGAIMFADFTFAADRYGHALDHNNLLVHDMAAQQSLLKVLAYFESQLKVCTMAVADQHVTAIKHCFYRFCRGPSHKDAASCRRAVRYDWTRPVAINKSFQIVLLDAVMQYWDKPESMECFTAVWLSVQS